MASSPPTIAPDTLSGERKFTWSQRLALFFISRIGYFAIRLIAPTLRWNIEVEDGGPPNPLFYPAIYAFWHRCVFACACRFGNSGIAVMTSSSFDGEYIARIIERCGFRAVRGSSSRGGVRALLKMHKLIEDGQSVAFTIDGPRGPRYVAKPGPVLLARNTGVPICCLHVAVEKAWVFNSWDRFMLPKPFSRALLRIGRTLSVPQGCSSKELERHLGEMQATLDRLRETAEKNLLHQTGSNA